MQGVVSGSIDITQSLKLNNVNTSLHAPTQMQLPKTTLPEPLANALNAYIHDQEIPPSTTDVVQAALAQFLAEKGYLPSLKKRLKITPALTGSGYTDTSINHDIVIASPQ